MGGCVVMTVNAIVVMARVVECLFARVCRYRSLVRLVRDRKA